MANTARDLIKARISNTPGTSGGFTLSTAFTNSLLPVAGDDGLSFKLNVTENGVGTELRKDCTYTHSSTSFSRGTMVRSTGAGDAALNFTAAAIVSVVPSAEDYINFSLSNYSQVVTMDKNVTILLPALLPIQTATYRITLVQSGGGWIAYWPPSVTWAGGVEPQPPVVNGEFATFEFVTANGGQSWYGSRSHTVTAAKAFDKFNRANSASSLGTATIGGAWTAHTGTWGIFNKAAYLPTRSGDSLATLDAGSATHAVYCDVAPGHVATVAGVVGRYVDTSNFWLVRLSYGTLVPQAVDLIKCAAGVYTQPIAYAEIPAGSIAVNQSARLGIRFSGNAITISCNGIDYGSVTDAAHNTATRAGLRLDDAYNAGTSWANFVVV